MAVAAADLLTDQHRRAQLALRAATIRDLLRLWPLLDINDIARTWPAFETALITLTQARAPMSAALAADFFQAVRTASGTTGGPPTLAPTPSAEELTPGFRVVGAVNAGRQLARGGVPSRVAEATLVNVAGELGRQVLNTGRSTIVENAKRHGARVRRVTDRDPCKWCSDQASRTYPPGTRFPAHSHCACFPAPIF